MEADAVGHDLSRGITTFVKMRAGGPQSVIEDGEAENRIGGELSYPAEKTDQGTSPRPAPTTLRSPQ